MSIQCKKCNQVKPNSEFYKTASNCKPCHSKAVMANQKKKSKYYNKYRKHFSRKHPAKARAWQKAFIQNWEKKTGRKYSEKMTELYHERMKDKKYAAKVKQKAKQYRLANKKKLKSLGKTYYTNHCELLNATAMIRYWNNRLKAFESDKAKEKSQITCKIYALQKTVKRLKGK